MSQEQTQIPQVPDVRFWDHRCETTGWLSNFHPAPITAGGVMWPTSEHLYQASKWSAEEDQRRIREIENPGLAKGASRIIGGLIGEPSITRKATLMRCAIRAKFGQHPDLAAKLAETRGVIVEASPTDNVWGIGAGDGLNLMGLLLMELRSELQANDNNRHYKMNDSQRLVGLLCFAGDLNVDNEAISGCAVEIDRGALGSAKLPLYEQCAIVTEAELNRMEAVIEAARCIRHWHDREPDGMVVSAQHVRILWAALRNLDNTPCRNAYPANALTLPPEGKIRYDY
jgi:ribA/ribD-fused uncharacterized protein